MNTRRLRVYFYVACLLPFDFAVGLFLLSAQVAAVPLMILRRSAPRFPPPQTAKSNDSDPELGWTPSARGVPAGRTECSRAA
jgi:hypothetical protein